MTDEQFLAYIATFKKDDRVIEIGQSGLMGRCGDVYFNESGSVCVLWDGWHDDDPPRGRMGSSVTHGTRLLKDVLAAARMCDGIPAEVLSTMEPLKPDRSLTQALMRDTIRVSAAAELLAPGLKLPVPPARAAVEAVFVAGRKILLRHLYHLTGGGGSLWSFGYNTHEGEFVFGLAQYVDGVFDETQHRLDKPSVAARQKLCTIRTTDVPAPLRQSRMSEDVAAETDREETAQFRKSEKPYEVCRRCGYVKTPEVSPHCKPRWKDTFGEHEWVRAVPRPAKTNADKLIEAGVTLAEMPSDTARCVKCGMTRSESRQKYCGDGGDKDNAHDYVPIPLPERNWQKVRSVFHTPSAGVLHDVDFASITVDPATGQPQRQPQVKCCGWCPNPGAPDPAFHPGGQTEHVQPASPPDAKMLAFTFKEVLRRWLTPARLQVVDDRNKAETDPRICHSHDLCDSNQAMIDALGKYGIEFNGQDDQQHNLINAAWDIAKKEGFST